MRDIIEGQSSTQVQEEVGFCCFYIERRRICAVTMGHMEGKERTLHTLKRISRILTALVLATVLLVSPLVVPTIHVTAQEPNAGWEEVGAQGSQNVELVGSASVLGSRDVEVSGGYAYVAALSNGLRVVDISDPANPIEVGSIDTPGQAMRVSVSYPYAYVADDYDGGMRIIDVSDPVNPVEMGFYDTDASAIDVYVLGDRAYLLDGAGLKVISVGDPTSPYWMGYIHVNVYGYGIYVVEPYAYVASYHPLDGISGLRIMDISWPYLPSEVGYLTLPGWPQDVAVARDYAYIAAGTDGLRIIDVSNPANPIEMGSLDTPDFAYDVAVSGSRAYVADSSGGLRIVDISNPANPTEVGFTEEAGAIGVAVSGNYIYTAGGGLYIWRYTGGIQPIDTGFRPNQDGYSFPNFEGFVPDDFTTNDLRRLFGDNAVCYGGGGGTCQVKPPAQSWYTESTGWLAENAHCDAFISTSLRFFTDYDTHPSFATTHDLQESSNVIANWQTYTSSTTARRNITFFMARAMVKPVSDAWESGYGEPDDTLTMLYSKMSAGGENLPTLFIRDRSHKSAHAVTPYAIEDLGAGVYHVRVYDSNSPSDPNRYIEIDTNANTWSCNLAGDMGGWNGDATSDSIGTQSISRYDEPAQPPWLIHGVDHIWLTAGNIALISNSQGLRIGLVGGQLINEIPGAYYRVVPTGDSTEPIYRLPITDTYTILLDGQTLTSSATARVTQFGLGYGVSVDVGDIDSSTRDNITISPDGRQVSLNPNHDITEGLLEMAVDGDTEGYHFQIWDAHAKAGETISLTNNDAQGWLSLSNADASVDGYTLDVKRVSAAGEQFFSHYVNILPTDTHHIDYGSWDGGNTMALHIDHGSDGTVDETLVLSSQAVGIYLPIILKSY